MEKTRKGVNYVAVEQLLDQLQPFIIDRYVEIYNYNPIRRNADVYSTDYDRYLDLIIMLEACYEEDKCCEIVKQVTE